MKLSHAEVAPKAALADSVLDSIQDIDLDFQLRNSLLSYERVPFASLWTTFSTEMWLDQDLDNTAVELLENYSETPNSNLYNCIEEELDSQFDFVIKQKIQSVEREPSAYIWKEVQPKIPLSLIIKRIAQYSCIVGLLAFLIWLITPHAVEFAQEILPTNPNIPTLPSDKPSEPIINSPIAENTAKNSDNSTAVISVDPSSKLPTNPLKQKSKPNPTQSTNLSNSVIAKNEKQGFNLIDLSEYSSKNSEIKESIEISKQIELNIAALQYEKQSYSDFLAEAKPQQISKPKQTLRLGDLHSITGRKIVHSFFVPLANRGDRVRITLDVPSINTAVEREVFLQPIELIEDKVYLKDGKEVNIDDLTIDTELIIQFLDSLPQKDRKLLPMSVEEAKRQVRIKSAEINSPLDKPYNDDQELEKAP